MQTCRFGVRVHPNAVSQRFAVFDRITGTAVAGGTGRPEAESEAHRRNHDTSGQPAMTARRGDAEVAALQEAIDVHLAFQVTGRHGQILEALYALFASWAADHGR